MDHRSDRIAGAAARIRVEPAWPASITGWIRAGALDPELAALITVMVEHGLPLVVAAPAAGRAGGWSGPLVRDALGQTLLTCGLAPQPNTRTPAPLTVDADSLEAVLARMPLLSLDSADDAGARVAIVLILAIDAPADAWRIGAAHLLRPPLRDGHGHLQRQGPAVLATWDSDHQRFEHFAWGVLAELAALVDERAGDLEASLGTRSDLLAGLVAHAVDDPGAVRLAIEAARPTETTIAHRH